MSVLISVDWDFFLWRGCEARDHEITVFPGTPAEQRTTAWHFFDWGHNEGQSAALQDVLWQTRWAGIARVGLDPRAVAGFRDPTPDVFFCELSRRFPLRGGPLYVADSHALSYLAAAEVSAYTDDEVDVIHFDAHADMGYGGEEPGQVDCGNWLLRSAEAGFVRDVTFVYPDWLDDASALASTRAARAEIGRRVECLSWSTWLSFNQLRKTGARAEAVTVCRSSAWTPPWYDADFAELVAKWPKRAQCLDCAYPARKVGAHHGCTPRKWEDPR